MRLLSVLLLALVLAACTGGRAVPGRAEAGGGGVVNGSKLSVLDRERASGSASRLGSGLESELGSGLGSGAGPEPAVSAASGDVAVWYAMFCWQAIGIAAEQHPAWQERLKPGRVFYAGIAAALGYDGRDAAPLLDAGTAARLLHTRDRNRFARELRDCLQLAEEGAPAPAAGMPHAR